jgi:hypothetical protein
MSGVLRYNTAISGGDIDSSYDEFLQACGCENFNGDEDHSNIFGLGKKAQERKAIRFQNKQDRLGLRTESKAQARADKQKAKLVQSEAQVEAAKSSAQSDIAMGNALSNMTNLDAPKNNTILYVSIGAGVLVLSTIAYFVFKNK